MAITVLSGERKAAALLMSLDAAAAAELLKGLPVEKIQKVVVELSKLDASGQHIAKEQEKVVQEFCLSLKQGQVQRLNVQGFIDEMLTKILGKERAEQIRSAIKGLTQRKDPFATIRTAESNELLLALRDEHPQAIAVTLAELPSEKSQQVLKFLAEEVRAKAVCRMTSLDSVSSETRQRIAAMIEEKIQKLKAQQGGVVNIIVKPEENLRKVALLLSGLDKDLRDSLLGAIKQADEGTGQMVSNLMVTWEDIPTIADRSLQDALRSIETAKLAIALYGADEIIVRKIRSNISERASERLDEEISLMQEPLEKEVFEAREGLVKPLREANEQGLLRFVGR